MKPTIFFAAILLLSLGSCKKHDDASDNTNYFSYKGNAFKTQLVVLDTTIGNGVELRGYDDSLARNNIIFVRMAQLPVNGASYHIVEAVKAPGEMSIQINNNNPPAGEIWGSSDQSGGSAVAHIVNGRI